MLSYKMKWRWMKSTKSWKFKMGSCAKSIRDDLSKGRMIFSEETSRAIYERCHMELIELKQTSATIQCLSCLRQVPEGLDMCRYGVLVPPNRSTMGRIRAAFAALQTPHFRVAAILSRGWKSGHNPWQTDHVKAMDARRAATKNRRKFTLYWTDDRTTISTELFNWCTIGL